VLPLRWRIRSRHLLRGSNEVPRPYATVKLQSLQMLVDSVRVRVRDDWG
jgi:hypothetical protein